jgi:hypothetical protein
MFSCGRGTVGSLEAGDGDCLAICSLRLQIHNVTFLRSVQNLAGLQKYVGDTRAG